MIYKIEKTIKGVNEKFSDSSFNYNWNGIQYDYFSRLRSKYNISDEKLAGIVFTLGEKFAELADKLDRIPNFNEFTDYLKIQNVKLESSLVHKYFSIFVKESNNNLIKESHLFKKLLTSDLSDEKANIKAKLLEYGITNYTINSDGSINIEVNYKNNEDGNEDDDNYYSDESNEDYIVDLDLSGKGLTEIPFKFNNVNGDVNFSDNNLISLKGSPETLYGTFDCSYNKLTSLQYAPTEVGGSFNCSYNNLISLKGSPDNIGTELGGYFDCSNNPNLSSLEGIPEYVGGDFDCSYNPKLLETYGSKEGIIDYIKANCEVEGDIFVGK